MKTISDDSLELLCTAPELKASGQLLVDDADIRLKLAWFEGKAEVPSELPAIKLVAADGSFATLLSNIATRWSNPISEGVTTAEFTSSYVLIGDEDWALDQKIRRMSFSFYGASVACRYSEHLETPKSTESKKVVDIIDTSKLSIFDLSVHGIKISIWLSLAWASEGMDRQTKTTPMIHVEFDQGQSVSDALRVVFDVTTFFSLSMGWRSRPLEVRVNSISHHEQEERSKKDRYDIVASHKLRVHFDTWSEKSSPDLLGVALRVATVEQRSATKAALTKWIELRDAWSGAYTQLADYLKRNHTFDRTRVLSLAAWFEEIPSTAFASPISKEQVAKIAGAAHLCAIQVDADVSEQRLKGALSVLTQEGFAKRLMLAANATRAIFGSEWIPETLEEHLKSFAKFRHNAAHGTLLISKGNYKEVGSALAAAELLCFFLHTAAISPGGIHAISPDRNPLLRFLRLSKEGV
jgi:hypothetical protein